MLRVEVTAHLERPSCCGRTAWHHDTREVMFVDLPVFGRPARLAWHKHRWRCPVCRRTWTEQHPEIASARCVRSRPEQHDGRRCRSAGTAAPSRRSLADLGCDWHTVMDSVELYGTLLIDDPGRFGTVTGLGLDETLFFRQGRLRTQCWSTQIVDVRRGQLLDVVAGRDSSEPCRWLAARSDEWRAGVEWATLDLSASYRAVFDTMLPDAVQVADPFHVVKLANTALDECRRRVQNETLGHRGRKQDPLYRARRRVVIARERLSGDQHDRLMGLLRSGDPRREVWFAWNAKEVVRQIYDHTDPELAVEWVAEIGRDFTDPEMPPEVRRLGRTIGRWADQICAWHRSHVTNGPTEAVNNLAKRIKRVAFGLVNFRHHRVRCLLYAGRPDWTLLPTIQP